jgi:hypothetical protein
MAMLSAKKVKPFAFLNIEKKQNANFVPGPYYIHNFTNV